MERTPPLLDMTPDGAFRRPPRPAGPPLSFKLLVGAGLVAILAAAASIAVFALTVLSFLLPIVIVSAAVAYASFRYRQWRASLGRQRHVMPR